MEVILAIVALFVVAHLISKNSTNQKSELRVKEVQRIDGRGRVTTERTITGSYLIDTTTTKNEVKNIQMPFDIPGSAQGRTVEAAQFSREARPLLINDQTRVTTKTCAKCGSSRALSDFYHSDKRADGYSLWCRHCLDALDRPPARYKRCANCGQNRERWNFFNSSKSKDGLSKWCKPCHSKRRG